MRLSTKFSLATVLIVIVLSVLLESVSLIVFSRRIHALNKDLFIEKLDRLVSIAYEQDELFFEGVYEDIKEGQWKVFKYFDGVYRAGKTDVTFPFIVDYEGKVLFHPAGSRWNKSFDYRFEKGEVMFDAGIREFIKKNKEGEFEYKTPRGARRWCVFKTYEPWQWIFCVSTSLELIHKSSVSFMRVGILISGMAIAFSVLCAMLISKHYTGPIFQVISRLQEIARGDVKPQSQDVPILNPDDEVGLLAQAVQKMAEDLAKVTVSRDDLMKEVAERRRLERVVVQHEKMAAVGQLAAGVAHEINNPLGVILGFSQIIAKRIQPGDQLEKPALSIEREALRCKQLVQDLLTFSRTSKSEREPMDLAPCIEGALSLVVAQSKVKNVEIIKNLSSGLPLVLGNSNQIQQVVINLSNNAIDAMPKGGRLQISTRLHEGGDKKQIEIEFRDNGNGIPEDIRSKIFDPFFTTKEVGKGTGLGLSLVYEIVQKHEGKIEVDSKVGKGTTFLISLPV